MKLLSSVLAKFTIRIAALRYKNFWYWYTISKVLRMTAADKAALGIERTVRLLGNFPGLWQRTIEQTPGGSCQWGRTLFVAEGKADHYIILNAIHAPRHGPRVLDESLPDRQHVWALHMEPEEYLSILGYDRGEEHEAVSRFYTSSRFLLSRQGVYRASPPYVHFNLGVSWDSLMTMTRPKKTVLLGIISSDLKDLQGHVDRVKFLERLDASGIDYALWGRGEGLKKFRSYRGFVRTKWEAHSLCKYSIVIENSVSPLYWSEKVADALLAFSLPLYHGCTDLEKFLPARCVVPIDIRKADVIERIQQLISDNEYENRYEAILEARKVLLDKENLYAFVDRELNSVVSA